MTHSDFLQQLPVELHDIAIEPRHKVRLENRLVGEDMWVVLLTDMPGDQDKAWRLNRWQYWRIQPKHETRNRWIRENMSPTMTGQQNAPKPVQQSLF